ncbi:hypothetical protein OUZ56_031122 [Daphnia magna]|uniref:Uncharacterized protein n=1 Tax=Daphnia magna TaxID=35525 RepID=A0ABQ9ZU67_9CRUS|nr:hypothetical protein OUZ56_031122 [Daphnia magna]
MRPFESYRRQPRTISMASAVSDSVNEGSPQMNISVETAESVYFILSSAWRAGRTQWPQTAAEKAAEKNEYYKAYDPLTGLKIAATLSGFLTMAVLYVFYKAKCKRLKFMRSSSDEDSIVIDQPASQPHLQESNPGLTADSSAFYQVEVECGSANKFQHYCESGRETPSGSIVTSQQPALHQSTVTIKSSQPQYYADDSEMPAWKIYAKELFLYGGSGLWRSASLQKGSDPVLLVAQSSFDETINSRSQRTGSLSGSVMGGLGIYRCDSRKPSSVFAYPTRNSQSRLQVPNVQPKTACVSQLHRQRSLNRQDCSRQDEVITGSGRDQQLQSPFNKKNLPGRSVSFRESDMTNYSRSKRVARSRPGSLHNNRPDYSRLRSGSCSNAETGHLRPDTLAVGHRRSSFRTPSRQPSIRENRRHAITPSTSVDLPIPSLPPPSPRSRLAVVHRVHIQQPEDSKNKSTYCRSASLTSEPISRGWRSSIAKMIRAKSTSGNSVRSNGERTECSSPKNRRNRNPSSLANAEMGLAPSTKQEERDNGNSQREGHIDICVIQATPAASPCTSIRSTFSGDSLDSATAKNIPAFSSFQPSAVMSVRDRRKCFARMKGQTIDHDNALAIDTSFLAPPMVEYNVGLSPSSLLSYPLADLRSHRSTSPAGHSASTWLQVFNEEPHPLKDNCHPPTKRPAVVSTGNKSRSSALTGEHLGVGQLPSPAEVVKGGRPASQQVSNSSPTYSNTQQQSTPFPF